MPHAPDLAGCALDERYELDEMLGEGTFGRVYRATDRRLGRAVAVKVVKPWWAEDSAWVRRFHREAQLLARVNDPGVVQIFDIGSAAEGPYYVTELVDGQSLAQLLESGPLLVENAHAIAARLCRALGSAHRQGVTHCDVKPANILLGTHGSVKVGDFGVSRLADGSQAASETIAGTPRYMSPEQAQGQPPTAATDVYSAGVVLYEMLAGRPPFGDGSPVEMGLRHLQDPPPPLPSRVPEGLRKVVLRALAKDPADRYSDGAAMAEALHELRMSGTASAAAAPCRDSMPQTYTTVGAPVPVRGRARQEAAPTEILAGQQAMVAAQRGPAAARTVRRVGESGKAPVRAVTHSAGTRRRRLIGAAAVALLLAAGAAIVLTGGAARTTVPELRNLPRGGVEARAERLHVRPLFSRRYAEATAGVAVAQNPAAGTSVPDGSTVRVILSAGPPPVGVPGVVGTAAGSAESVIAAAGLRYSTRMVAAPGSEVDVVVRQSPSPPAQAPRGSTVALSLAERPRWRPLTTISGVDDGRSVAFRILGRRWRVAYDMTFRGTCLLLLVCEGPSAEVRDLNAGTSFGGFELEEGESQTHVVSSGPGLYRLVVSGGRDSASWSMTVEDYY